MSFELLKRLSVRNNHAEIDVIARRFFQIFQDHGVEKSQISRLMPKIKLGDLKSNETLLEVLTPEILDQTASLLGVRSEWLEGIDEVIYESLYCYKVPELLFELLATLRNHPDFDLTGFPLRVLVSNKNLDFRADRDQFLVPVLLEKVADLGDKTIYRYYVFNDGFSWSYGPARIQLKATARIAYKLLGTPIPLMVISPTDLQSVLDRKKISRKFLDGCLLTDPSLEDFALTSQESAVAAEVDEIPIVLKYIEDHKLEGFLTNALRPISPPQDTTIEDQLSTEPSAPVAIEPKTGKRANNEQQLWEPVRAVAGALWAADALPIAEVIRRIQRMPHLKASTLSASAIRKHIDDLAPATIRGKPGRKPNKSP